MAKLVAVDDIPKGARLVAVSDEEPSEPLGKRLNREIASIPRQLGLTARYGLEGLASVPQFLLGQPMEALGVKGAGSNVGETVSDLIGLPKPETTQEKVVGTGAKMLVPAGGFIKAGQVMQKAGNEVVRNSGKVLAANPIAQLESAAAGGAAGEYVKETGGDGASQFVASLAGGVGAPVMMNAARNAPKAVMDASKRFVEAIAPGVVKPANQNINVTINNVLRDSGIDFGQLPANVQASIRQDVSKALQMGERLSADALRRLVDYRTVKGTTPTRATVTLDPVAITQQKNLAKLGASSKDPEAQLLARTEGDNNQALIAALNEMGVNTADDISVANTVMGTLGRRNDHAKSVIKNRYNQAKATDGRSAMLEPSFFTNRANDLLDEALLGGKLPSDVRNLLNRAATGEMPLTVDVAEQLKTRIGDLQRSTMDKAERASLGFVRQALDETPLAGNQGQQAIDAFNKARKANRSWMQVVEKTPALQAVRDGMEPDKFVQKFVIGNGDGASVMSLANLKNLIKGDKEATGAIRSTIANHLKSRAIGNATDDAAANFSADRFNSALKSIGDRKLALFFSQEEINQLKAIGRIANYETAQPRGSAVNNSNTASATIATVLDRIANSPLLSKIPMGRVISDPIANISTGIQAKQATNIPASLVMPMKKKPRGMVISPAVGLLGFSE